MRIINDGKVRDYYIETLAMLFYPGEKFNIENDSRECEVSVEYSEDGAASRVRVKDGTRESVKASFVSFADAGERMAAKFSVGNAFCDASTELTGHTPPWGILTGVRPAKLAAELFENGRSESEVREYFEKIYRTTAEKAKLATLTAKTAASIDLNNVERECSVYIAIPFCPTRCAYCSFVSYTTPKLLSLIPEYLNILAGDIERTEKLIKELGMKVTSVYIGGGTPTVLDEKQLDFLLGRLHGLTDGVREFTLEAGRPDTINDEKMRIASSHGVGRVSVNTQTLNDDILRSIGRAHDSNDFFRAYECAVKAGIPSKNVDLIAGLPGESSESFARSVDGIIKCAPESITVHTFSVKRSARLKVEGGDVFDRDGYEAAKSVSYSAGAIEGAGYLPYYMYRQKNTVGNLENVGYSLPGHEGLYNILMMDELQSIFACGASAVTKLVSQDRQTIERIFEPKYPFEYFEEHKSDSFDGKYAERVKFVKDFFTEKL